MSIDRTISSIGVDSGADNGKVPVYNNTTKVFDMTTPSGGSGAMTLLKANSGQAVNISVAPTDFDTLAITGLTAKDTLYIVYTMEATVQGTSAIALTNSTDTVNIVTALGSITSGANSQYTATIRQARSANTKIIATNIGMVANGTTLAPTQNTATFTTAWTGSWTLAFRSTTATNGGTIDWSWAVFKIAGQ